MFNTIMTFIKDIFTSIGQFFTKHSSFFLPFFIGCACTFAFCWFNPRTITNTVHTENSTKENHYFGDIAVGGQVTGNNVWEVKPKDPTKKEADIELVDANLGVVTFAAVNNKGAIYDTWVMNPAVKTAYFFKDNKLTQTQTINFEGKINIDGIIAQQVDSSRKRHEVGVGQLGTTSFVFAGTEVKKNTTLSGIVGKDWKESKTEFGFMATKRF